MIAGIRDHHRLEHLITIPGMRSHLRPAAKRPLNQRGMFCVAGLQGHGKNNLVYKLEDSPATVMTQQQRSVGTEVKHLATHPAGYRAGETMLELAISRFLAAGRRAKVSLVATPEAQGFHEKNGFNR
ncbi:MULTISPECIES: hypothetical protein [unclassified Bradyrhizobium]|uniref:hypothetical protein n=1 Tax=unclassified Bradyrhizobium TaxID=2631580 RepID=UPI000481DC21|nr:hypothetical protein [Bradyrhizobium sp. WSM1417]